MTSDTHVKAPAN